MEAIVNYTPKNPAAAVAILLALFALKGVSIVVYGGILYAASGILFPLPLALVVNIVGTVLMTGVPFLIGKVAGAKLIDRLVERNATLRKLQSASNRNEIAVCFVVRMIGLLPGDLVGMYMGASGFRWGRYLLGTLAGMFASIVIFTVIGTSARDVSSPAFWIALGCELALMFASLIAYCLWKRMADRGKEGRNE